MHRIYLDHNATTPLDPRVLDAMQPYLNGRHGNPSSLHREGREARRAVEDAREETAALIGAEPGEVVFTSGATEANSTALFGLMVGMGESPLPTVALSTVEHPSVRAAAERLEREGRARRVLVPVDSRGRLELEALDAALEEGCALVAVMAANNEVGTLQPVSEIAERCAGRSVPYHVDAVQMVGKVPFRVPDAGPATGSLSAHKFGGPKGIGALWVRRETRLRPLLEGGSQERERRAGTENVAAIVGLGQACRLARQEVEARRQRLASLEAILMGRLRAGIPGVHLHGPADHDGRLPGTLNIRFPGVPGEALLLGLDLEGVAVSLGSACSSGAVEPSQVLDAMGISKVENLESLRISLSWSLHEVDLELAAETLIRVSEHNLRT